MEPQLENSVISVTTLRQFHPAPEDLLRGGKARGAEYWENFTLTTLERT
jgi:hypothetical protein